MLTIVCCTVWTILDVWGMLHEVPHVGGSLRGLCEPDGGQEGPQRVRLGLNAILLDPTADAGIAR